MRLLWKGLLLGLLCLGTEVTLFFTVPENPYSYYKAYDVKQKRLASLGSPKAVLIGGSSLSFGMDSTALERRLGMPVVNMGLNGALGLDFMLRQVRSFVGKGDLLLLMPEYLNFSDPSGYRGALTKTLAEFLLENKGELRTVGWLQIPALLKYMPVVIAERFRFVLRMRTWRPAIEQFRDPVYDREAFDERGDLFPHLLQSPRIIADPGPFRDRRYRFSRGAVRCLNEFHDYCERRGARAVLVFSCLRESDYESGVRVLADVVPRLNRLSRMQIVGRPEDFVYPDRLFYDTAQHLTVEGRVQRTERLAQLLEEAGLAAL